MKKVKDKEDEHFILKVIGKLQAYNNNNTKEIEIPDKFKSSTKITEICAIMEARGEYLKRTRSTSSA